jgi:hypothetical protein
LAEWLYEAGIGEARAALVEDGAIVEALIETDAACVRAGTVADARLTQILTPRMRGIAVLADGSEVLVEPLARGWTEGAAVRVEIVREAIAEPGRAKRAKARPADGLASVEGPDLRARLAASGLPVTELGLFGEDRLEQAGWTEVLESAPSGLVDFPGGTLVISPTPAMTVIDVDGHSMPDALALAAADAVARTIRRLGIAGSIGVDFPTVAGKAERIALGDAFDAALPPPFERTAVNGFGFMHVVRPRARASLIEQVQGDPARHAARALLRRAQRSQLIGSVTLAAHPAVISVLTARPDWTEALGRSLGGTVALRSDPALAMAGGYAEPT